MFFLRNVYALLRWRTAHCLLCFMCRRHGVLLSNGHVLRMSDFCFTFLVTKYCWKVSHVCYWSFCMLLLFCCVYLFLQSSTYVQYNVQSFQNGYECVEDIVSSILQEETPKDAYVFLGGVRPLQNGVYLTSLDSQCMHCILMNKELDTV